MIEINKFICIGCGWCKDVCSTNAVQLAFAGEENYVCFNDIIVKNTCTNCGICINFCPVAAISPLTYKIPGTDVDVTNPDVTIPSVIDDGIWGGSGGTGLITDSPDYGDDSNYNTGITVLDILDQRINQDSACFFELDNRTNAFINGTSMAMNAKSMGSVLVQALKADDALVVSLGKTFSQINIGFSFLQFYIGIQDGSYDVEDWCNLGSALCGIGAIAAVECPPLAVILGVGSAGLGIYASAYSECK